MTMLDLPGAVERVDCLIAEGLVVDSPRADRVRAYAVDTRDSVSLHFRRIVIDAIDSCLRTEEGLLVAAVANSGTLLCAMWAGATGNSFWNALVDGPRSRGFGRDLEPASGVHGGRFVLVDNHARSGASLRAARGIIESHGGTVACAMVFTAGDQVNADMPVYVALPHGLILHALACPAESGDEPQVRRKVDA